MAHANLQFVDSSTNSTLVDLSVDEFNNCSINSYPTTTMPHDPIQHHIAPNDQQLDIIPMPTSDIFEKHRSSFSNEKIAINTKPTSPADNVNTRNKYRPTMPQLRPRPATDFSLYFGSAKYEAEPELQITKPKSKPGRAKRGKGGKRVRLERNRFAATKCRQKKKEWMKDLEDKKTSVEKKHRDLTSEYSGLLDEVTELKTSLIAHGNCQDSNILSWISNQAAQYANRVRGYTKASSASSEEYESSTPPNPSESVTSELPLPHASSTSTEYYQSSALSSPLDPLMPELPLLQDNNYSHEPYSLPELFDQHGFDGFENILTTQTQMVHDTHLTIM